MTALLSAQRVSKIFRSGLVQRKQTVALKDFSLTIGTDQPSITAVVGESGSGKSTMTRLLLGLETPTHGAVLYKGEDLRRLGSAKRRQFLTDVQAVFQDPFASFNPFYKIDHVLEVPIAKFGLTQAHENGRALMDEVLRAVGLRPQETLGRYPHQLSGGQRQRVMVARALLVHPKLIVADEPVSMIDASLRATVLDSLQQLNEELGISLLYITHDLTTAYQISHDIIVLYAGAVVEAGAIEPVVKQPQHPYTQLLISSIPLPDPNRQWPEEAPPSALGKGAKPGAGCVFAPRCPHAFGPCLEASPPLFRTGQHQLTACYLFDQYDSVSVEEMDSVFVRKVIQPVT
ncbi:MAG: ABC transporter ATP-binding protein [Anaerolineae bacterium]|nr:ABC transporter ATP-binding protein [Anaerolineae bacterium]